MFSLSLPSTSCLIATFSPLLAEGSKLKSSLAWGIVLLCIVLGILVTLQPVKRKKEVDGRQE